MRDLRFGLRMLRRNPGFTLVAIFTLALAIGANTAIFSVTSAMLLRPFPYAQPQQLVSIENHDSRVEGSNNTLVRYEFLRDHAHTVTVAAWTNDTLDLTGAGEPAQLPVARVTPDFFSMLGVAPALGRTFVDADGRPESRPVILLSNALWRARFHSNPATMALLAVFSLTALLLAAIGLAAMLAWTVVQRRQELAIRLALGADRRHIRWLVVRHGLTLSATGIALGLAAGLLLTRLMSSVLYKTSAVDLRTFVLAPLVFLAIAALASYLPARRATQVDPLETLKAG